MKKALFLVIVGIIIIVLIFIMFKDKKEESSANVIPEPNEKIINVPNLCQYPNLPTGCEATAAAMALRYYGVNINAEEFAGMWLDCSQGFYTAGGELYGPAPNEVFAGDPFSESSYGCYASAIVKAVNGNSTECTALKITDKTLSELCNDYIARDKPLLIWATMSMKESKQGRKWLLNDGSEFIWTAGEHCLVLVGYGEDYYYFNDPQSGSTVAYQKGVSEKRFKELGSQAVYIYKR